MNINKNIYLSVGILLLIVSLILRFTAPSKDNINRKMVSFDSVSNINEEAYLYIDYVLLSEDNIVIVLKDNKEYVLKVNEDITEKINNTEFDGTFYRVVGFSKSFDSEMKTKIVNIYNKKYDYSMDSQINESEVESQFSNYYLEVEDLIDDRNIGNTNRSISNLLLEIGIILCAVFVIKVIIMKRDF